jgi:hypothetical protein
MESDLPPEIKKTGQDDSSYTRPQDKPEHHRSEAKTYGILSLWMLGDLLVILGFQHGAIWILAAVIWMALSIFTYHAVKAWKTWRIVLCAAYAVLYVSAPIVLYFSRSENSAQSTADTSLQQQTNSAAWLPPEIPNDCSNVIVWFGGDGKIYPVPLLSKTPYGPTPEWFPISQATPEEKAIMPTIPGFTPQAKKFMGQLITSNFVNGLPENDYTIVPQIVGKRLFVYVKIPFLAGKQKIVMSDEMDSVLTNCLPQGDRCRHYLSIRRRANTRPRLKGTTALDPSLSR